MATRRLLVLTALISAWTLSGCGRSELDVVVTHANGHPLDLEKLLTFSEGDFSHDILGIDTFLDRKTGTLLQLFSPRVWASSVEQELFFRISSGSVISPTDSVSSDLQSLGLPNTALSAASATMVRLSLASCRPWALM